MAVGDRVAHVALHPRSAEKGRVARAHRHPRCGLEIGGRALVERDERLVGAKPDDTGVEHGDRGHARRAEARSGAGERALHHPEPEAARVPPRLVAARHPLEVPVHRDEEPRRGAVEETPDVARPVQSEVDAVGGRGRPGRRARGAAPREIRALGLGELGRPLELAQEAARIAVELDVVLEQRDDGRARTRARREQVLRQRCVVEGALAADAQVSRLELHSARLGKRRDGPRVRALERAGGALGEGVAQEDDGVRELAQAIGSLAKQVAAAVPLDRMEHERRPVVVDPEEQLREREREEDAASGEQELGEGLAATSGHARTLAAARFRDLHPARSTERRRRPRPRSTGSARWWRWRDG